MKHKRYEEIQGIIQELREAELEGTVTPRLYSRARYALLELLDMAKEADTEDFSPKEEGHIVSFTLGYEESSDTSSGFLDISKLGHVSDVANYLRQLVGNSPEDASIEFGYSDSRFSYEDWERFEEIFWGAEVKSPQNVKGNLAIWIGA